MSALMRHKALAALVVVLLAAGTAGATLGLGLQPWSGGRGAASTATAGPVQPGPGLDLPTPPEAPAVLGASDGGPPVSERALRKHLAPVLAQPGLDGLGFAVTQLGNPALDLRIGEGLVAPASTMKLLTAAAALSALGPDHRFATTVVRGRQPGSVVLVGGGDPLLTDATVAAAEDGGAEPASLQQLAATAAGRLAAQGLQRVTLGYDDSLFTGPAVNPRWPATYLADSVVSPITALWVDEGRRTPGQPERSSDPARAAAVAFRDQLRKEGIAVTLAPERRQASGAAGLIASVSSPPLDQIVEQVLSTSDNEGAEVLLRQVAIAAGLPGSSLAGVSAVRRALTELGLRMRGAVLYDGSGLSRDDAVPVALLLDVLRTASAAGRADLRAVLTGLPVAGFNGSLGYRFQSPDAGDGLGYVRAKTGTLTGVHGLAGLAVTRGGQVLLFVAIADEVPVAQTQEARDDLDELAAALTTCGC